MSDQLYDYPVVYDVTLEGGSDKKGQIQESWNAEALNNSLKMWISSFRGDIIRQADRAGYIAPLVMKPMNQVDVDQFEQIVRDGFNDDFRPFLRILTLEITPNYERRYWEIFMQVYSPDLKIHAEVSERIKAQTTG